MLLLCMFLLYCDLSRMWEVSVFNPIIFFFSIADNKITILLHKSNDFQSWIDVNVSLWSNNREEANLFYILDKTSLEYFRKKKKFVVLPRFHKVLNFVNLFRPPWRFENSGFHCYFLFIAWTACARREAGGNWKQWGKYYMEIMENFVICRTSTEPCRQSYWMLRDCS